MTKISSLAGDQISSVCNRSIGTTQILNNSAIIQKGTTNILDYVYSDHGFGSFVRSVIKKSKTAVTRAATVVKRIYGTVKAKVVEVGRMVNKTAKRLVKSVIGTFMKTVGAILGLTVGVVNFIVGLAQSPLFALIVAIAISLFCPPCIVFLGPVIATIGLGSTIVLVAMGIYLTGRLSGPVVAKISLAIFNGFDYLAAIMGIRDDFRSGFDSGYNLVSSTDIDTVSNGLSLDDLIAMQLQGQQTGDRMGAGVIKAITDVVGSIISSIASSLGIEPWMLYVAGGLIGYSLISN